VETVVFSEMEEKTKVAAGETEEAQKQKTYTLTHKRHGDISTSSWRFLSGPVYYRICGIILPFYKSLSIRKLYGKEKKMGELLDYVLLAKQTAEMQPTVAVLGLLVAGALVLAMLRSKTRSWLISLVSGFSILLGLVNEVVEFINTNALELLMPVADETGIHAFSMTAAAEAEVAKLAPAWSLRLGGAIGWALVILGLVGLVIAYVRRRRKAAKA
jgi:4-amino-4-deoxy-L-arabinose transferase-like glycosyltransferase